MEGIHNYVEIAGKDKKEKKHFFRPETPQRRPVEEKTSRDNTKRKVKENQRPKHPPKNKKKKQQKNRKKDGDGGGGESVMEEIGENGGETSTLSRRQMESKKGCWL